ncbi:MAG: PepSY domain-containing protein, partial [Mycobacteriaceae bacterium]
IVSATLMWWKRRPTGSVGLPGATSDTMRSNTPRGAVVAVGAIAAGLAVVYPSFGMTLVVVLIAEVILAARRKRVTQPSD